MAEFSVKKLKHRISRSVALTLDPGHWADVEDISLEDARMKPADSLTVVAFFETDLRSPCHA